MFFSLALLLGTVWADVSESFNQQLTGYQQSLPKECQIASPQMKLAYACSSLQTESSNPRFLGVAETAGVNFCYSSLVQVERNGSRLKVSVFRDVGNNLRRNQYTVDEKNLKKDSFGDYVLPLENIAHCFAYDDANKSLCTKGLLGSADIPMTIKLRKNSAGEFDLKHTSDRTEINSNRRNGQQLNAKQNFDKDEATLAALNYAQTQLVNYSRKANPKPQTNELQSFAMCDQMLTEYLGRTEVKPELKPEDALLLTQTRQRMATGKPGEKEKATRTQTGTVGP